MCFLSPWAQLESRGRVGRFSRSAKVQQLPASRSSSELSAHQMAPGGVIAHQRGRPALEPMEILSSVQRRARCIPLWDGDSEPRRYSPRWTFSLRFLLRAFPLFFGFPILLGYVATYVFLGWRMLPWYAVIPGCFPCAVCVPAQVHHCKGVPFFR